MFLNGKGQKNYNHIPLSEKSRDKEIYKLHNLSKLAASKTAIMKLTR